MFMIDTSPSRFSWTSFFGSCKTAVVLCFFLECVKRQQNEHWMMMDLGYHRSGFFFSLFQYVSIVYPLRHSTV